MLWELEVPEALDGSDVGDDWAEEGGRSGEGGDQHREGGVAEGVAHQAHQLWLIWLRLQGKVIIKQH